MVKCGVPQGIALGPLLSILYKSNMRHNIESNIIAYVDDTTLFAYVDHVHSGAQVANQLNTHLSIISDWCNMWSMLLNPNKSHSLVVSRTRSQQLPHPPLILNGSVIQESKIVKLLGIHIDSKLTFEYHLRHISNNISQKIGIVRKCLSVFNDSDIARKCFNAFILPLFEYCYPVWMSAADCHINLLLKNFRCLMFLLQVPDISIEHRWQVSMMCTLFKIVQGIDGPLHSLLAESRVVIRETRQSANLNSCAFNVVDH